MVVSSPGTSEKPCPCSDRFAPEQAQGKTYVTIVLEGPDLSALL